jgi:hypothetical protein
VQRTLQALTTLVERELAQYAGASVQLYAEPIIQQRIQQAFDYIFTLTYWPQFRVRELKLLNAATGMVTIPFANIKQWDDVQFVFRQWSDRPIPELPEGFSTQNLIGTQAQWLEPRIDAYLFTVYPLTATDQIEVIGRNRPAALFNPTDVVPFDDWAIVHYAAWTYLVDDASNPGAASKQQALFDTRIKQLKDQSEKGVIYLNPRGAQDIPQRWS